MTLPTPPSARTPSRLLIAAALVIAALAALFYVQNPLTRSGQAYAERVATTAAATYLSLRAVNAFLSTAQELEVGGSMVVTGSGKPLKWLEPVDDTVERIAGAVFGVMLVAGLLAVALGPVGGVGWALVAVAAALWLLPGQGLHGLARRLASYGGFLGLALPAAFLLSSVLAGVMTDDVWDRNAEIVAELTASLGTEALQSAPQSRLIPDVVEDLDRYRALAWALYDKADVLIGSYIAILAVYFFNLLVLPALLIGGFFVGARWAADS